MWPQYLYLALLLIGVGVSVARFGERKRDSYDIVDVVLGPALTLYILYCGGFFASIGWAP